MTLSFYKRDVIGYDFLGFETRLHQNKKSPPCQIIKMEFESLNLEVKKNDEDRENYLNQKNFDVKIC